MKKPDFFIVGAPRCGTTSMNTYLKQHPDIFMGQKESHFFATDLSSPWFIKGRDQYLSLFSGAEDEKRVGEASVMYLYSRNAAENIKKFVAEAKIIIMLRNPADLLCSLHNHNLSVGIEDIADFETAINAETDRKHGLRLPDRDIHLLEGLYYREFVKFTQQVKRYTDMFGKNSVQVIIYDDFKNNLAEIYKKTLRFLEVSSDFMPEFEVHSPNRMIRSHILNNFVRTRHVQKFLDKAMPGSLRRLFERIFLKMNTFYAPQAPMHRDLRKRLQNEFEPEIISLGELLSLDLSRWLA